jgi:hypothetical protein
MVLVKNIRCYICDTSTPISISSLEEKLGYRSSPLGIELFFACPDCKTVGQSEVPMQSQRLAIAEDGPHSAATVACRVLLACDKPGCDSRIEVLGTMKKDVTSSQLQTEYRLWKFSREVQCLRMHRPLLPPEIVGLATGE